MDKDLNSLIEQNNKLLLKGVQLGQEPLGMDLDNNVCLLEYIKKMIDFSQEILNINSELMEFLDD